MQVSARRTGVTGGVVNTALAAAPVANSATMATAIEMRFMLILP
jgi:hypothetical protein